jgi:hypothetical protein
MREEAKQKRRESLLDRAFKPGDALLVAGVLALAAALILSPWSRTAQGAATVLVVEVNGSEVMRIPLPAEPADHQVDGFRGVSRFHVQGEEAWMIDSACPDKLCVGMGRVREPGQAVVCLPNRVTLRVEGNGGTDAVQR